MLMLCENAESRSAKTKHEKKGEKRNTLSSYQRSSSYCLLLLSFSCWTFLRSEIAGNLYKIIGRQNSNNKKHQILIFLSAAFKKLLFGRGVAFWLFWLQDRNAHVWSNYKTIKCGSAENVAMATLRLGNDGFKRDYHDWFYFSIVFGAAQSYSRAAQRRTMQWTGRNWQ